MAAADQIKSLIKSFGDGDEEHFFASAMQIAASEARKGHTTFAQELKTIIESRSIYTRIKHSTDCHSTNSLSPL